MLYKRKNHRKRIVRPVDVSMIESREEQNLACRINALNPTQQAKHQTILKQILSIKHEVKEISAGYEINFPYDPSLFLKISEWIHLEHLCCPFFTFNIQLQREKVQLSITGSDQVKRLLREQIQLVK
jgi:hypothetical protein